LILSEVRFLSECLERALCDDARVNVLGCCSTVEAAIDAARQSAFDLLLLDASFRGGVAAVRQMNATEIGARIVVLAVIETEENVLSWIRAGVAGYVPHTARLEEIPLLLAGIVRGEQTCSASIAGTMLRQLGKTGPPHGTAAIAPLTERERQILRLIGTGRANKDIARELGISLATTKSHVHNLLGKLGVRHRGQAAAWMHGAQ
jgi:DNA-binding NarL/FixJ family response regulator